MVGMLPNSRVTYLDKSALVNIRPAGQPVEWDIGTKECLDFPVPNETPAENQRFRYERKFPVGASSVHPSTVKDVLPDGPFGRKNVKEAGDDTATAIKPYPQFAGGQQLLEFNEAKYDRCGEMNSAGNAIINNCYVAERRMMHPSPPICVYMLSPVRLRSSQRACHASSCIAHALASTCSSFGLEPGCLNALVLCL